jgi:hypothetical protein
VAGRHRRTSAAADQQFGHRAGHCHHAHVTSERDPGTEEPESPATASLIEERFDAVTAEAERSVITPSIVESALIPTSLESVVESSVVVMSAG